MSTPDFFRSRLDGMIDPRQPMAVLAIRMPWNSIEAALAPVLARKGKDDRNVVGEDLFGPTLAAAGAGISPAGPASPADPADGRTALLKHAYNERDESECERWVENVYWQYLCGEEYFQMRLPCDPTNLVRFRQVLVEAGVEELLATTIVAAVQMKVIKLAEFERGIVDTKVQEKAIAYRPTAGCWRWRGPRWCNWPNAPASSSSRPLPGKVSRCDFVRGLWACQAVQTAENRAKASAYRARTRTS